MAATFDVERHPHRRFNPLTGEWSLVSPHRAERPWQGREDPPAAAQRPRHSSECYLCPGNKRAGGARNPQYEHTFVFTNDFAALKPDVPVAPADGSMHPLLQARPTQGTCRVICYSPRHDLTLADMTTTGIRLVVEQWCKEEQELREQYAWVQIFENKGELMGTSAPHPHGQVWAVSALPTVGAREDERQREYRDRTGTRLLLDYAMLEQSRNDRVVMTGEHWLAVVPWWAVWPFETLLLPRREVSVLTDLDASERDSLAQILKRLLTGYDRLFAAPFPYSMGWHTAPGAAATEHWQLHCHFYPPLLRSASIRKFMVGYEMLAESQRDITPEIAAALLREAL